MYNLTERQLEILGSIWSYIRSYGEFPSYRELMQVLKLKSKQTIADFLGILERKGYIIKNQKIGLTEKALQYLMDQEVIALGFKYIPSYDFFTIAKEGIDSTASNCIAQNQEFNFIGDYKSLIAYHKPTKVYIEDSVSQIQRISDTQQITMGKSAPVKNCFNINTTKGNIQIKNLTIQNIAGNIYHNEDYTRTVSQTKTNKFSLIEKLKLSINKLSDLF